MEFRWTYTINVYAKYKVVLIITTGISQRVVDLWVCEAIVLVDEVYWYYNYCAVESVNFVSTVVANSNF